MTSRFCPYECSRSFSKKVNEFDQNLPFLLQFSHYGSVKSLWVTKGWKIYVSFKGKLHLSSASTLDCRASTPEDFSCSAEKGCDERLMATKARRKLKESSHGNAKGLKFLYFRWVGGEEIAENVIRKIMMSRSVAIEMKSLLPPNVIKTRISSFISKDDLRAELGMPETFRNINQFSALSPVGGSVLAKSLGFRVPLDPCTSSSASLQPHRESY